jgi:hypothetical protein
MPPCIDAAGVATEADQLLSCCPPSERTSNEI